MRSKPTKAYWSAYAQLYGNKPAEPIKKRAKPVQKEETEQIKYVVWFEKWSQGKDIRWWHTPNGGMRNAIVAAKLKRLGVKAGIPDITVPVARKGYHGLVIELKAIDASPSAVSEVQHDWLGFFQRQGWQTHVAFGFEQARKFTEDYFNENCA